MKFRFLILVFLIYSCATNTTKIENRIPYNSKGFAYIYNETDYKNKIIKGKLDNNKLQISVNGLKTFALVKIINPKTNDSLIIKNTKRINYPDFYKILMTEKVAKKLKINNDVPFVEILEIKKNKSFIAEKAKIYNEEKRISSNAPVSSVKISNISKNKNKGQKIRKEDFFILIGSFYSKDTANFLKKRITKQIPNYDIKKLKIIKKRTKQINLLSGPYNTINLMKNVIVIIFYFFSFFCIATANPNINARTGILIDYHSDKILYELDADSQIYPASMTKIMTSIVAFDLLKKNKLSLDDTFVVSENAWRLSQSGYSSMFIMVNDEVSVEDLLRGIIVASGNDACVALAEGIAGSEENFAEMMNEKAAEIGMMSTNFTNSSGINDPDNTSTVRDIALMSKFLIENYPIYYEMFKEKNFTWDRTGGDPIKQGNRNPLLYKNVGADGVKTGYLAVEKYSLASSIIKNDRRLIAVVSGFPSKNIRSSHSLKLLNWGFRNTNTFEISKKGETTFELDTWLGKRNKIKANTKEDYYVTINKKNISHLKVSLKYVGPIVAPVQKGEKIADLVISNKDEIIKSLPLFASEDLKKVNFFKSLVTSINYLIWGDV